MAKDERLIRRGDSFYYQRRVPVDLVSALGKKVIKQSLNTKDRVEARTPVINVNANVEIDVKTGKPMLKSLKNESSKRRIPVHQELVKVGFLNFVDSARDKHENCRLFPTLKGGKYGHVSKYPTRRFNETYLRQDMGLEGRQSFHSFRHSFRDALRLIDASADTLEALGGWSQGKLVSSTYGTVSHPDHQSKVMNKIHYEGLELSKLYAIDWTKN